MVNSIKTKAEFDEAIKNNKKVAVDFTASWCPPCKMIGPKFEGFSKDFSGILFVKVDVDENSETAEANKISAMPTFQFFYNGEKSAELVGADEAKLEKELKALEAK